MPKRTLRTGKRKKSAKKKVTMCKQSYSMSIFILGEQVKRDQVNRDLK